jgi:hypothetical protein
VFRAETLIPFPSMSIRVYLNPALEDGTGKINSSKFGKVEFLNKIKTVSEKK